MADVDDAHAAAGAPARAAVAGLGAVSPVPATDAADELVVGVADARVTAAYLVAPGSDEYVAVMDVLEASVTELTPADVVAALAAAGHPLDEKVVVARLDKLREWSVVSARTDSSRILRYSDVIARNWRYTATPLGRKMHRFYKNVLPGLPVVREIPLTNLARLVDALEQLAALGHSSIIADGGLGNVSGAGIDQVVELVAQAFTAHDDLDGALVGAEDALAGLADRFDLDDEKAAELKGLLVDYATHVAVELRRGSARAARALDVLTCDFPYARPRHRPAARQRHPGAARRRHVSACALCDGGCEGANLAPLLGAGLAWLWRRLADVADRCGNAALADGTVTVTAPPSAPERAR